MSYDARACSSSKVAVKDNLIGTDGLITTFAQQRQTLLKRTGDILCDESSPVRQFDNDRAAKLSAVLVSSLEELKVAEEELVERTEALADLRDELEQRVRGAHQLFELAPACLLVTDIYGTIVDVNRACQQLLKRDHTGLERQPITRFIPTDGRRNFREELSRVVMNDGVNDWRLQLVRPTAGPLTVSASVRLVKPLAAGSPQRLFWSIRALEPDGAALDA
jgi:PAS domain-containing protein